MALDKKDLSSFLIPRQPLPPLSDQLLSLASSEYILPAIHPRLLAHHLLSSLPPPLADNLAAVTDLNRERNLLILNHAHSVIRILNQHANIQPIALKGLAYLLSGVFADPAERFLIDLDFLIPAQQIPAALQALTSAGFTHPPSHLDLSAAFRHHAPPLLAPAGTTAPPVELHHSIGLGLASRSLPASEVIAHATPHASGALIPSPEHLVTHLIIHSQIRHPYDERIRPPLRALDDLANLSRRFPNLDWSKVEHYFRAAGQLTTLKLHLLQAESDFDFPRPLPIYLTPFERLRWARRCLLNRYPALRYLDPTYLYLAAFSRRLRLLRSLLTTPGGPTSALRTLLTSGFYKRLFRDL